MQFKIFNQLSRHNSFKKNIIHIITLKYFIFNDKIIKRIENLYFFSTTKNIYITLKICLYKYLITIN